MPSDSQSRTPTCYRHRVPFFETIQLRVLKPLQVNGLSVFSNANFAWLLVQGFFSIHHHILHHIFLNLRVLFIGSSLFLTQTSKSTMEPLKRPFSRGNHEVIEWSVILAIVSRKMPHSSRSSEKREVPQSSDGTKTNHGTPKTNQATMEPSGVPHDFLATLYPENLKHPEKFQYCSSSQTVLPTLSRYPYLLKASTFLAPRKLA